MPKFKLGDAVRITPRAAEIFGCKYRPIVRVVAHGRSEAICELGSLVDNTLWLYKSSHNGCWHEAFLEPVSAFEAEIAGIYQREEAGRGV